MSSATDHGLMIALVTAFKLAHAADGAAGRAADKALTHLSSAPVLEFDPTELRVLSESRGRSGTHHVADGVACTCEGGRHPWCKHRAEYRLMLAALALTDPSALIRFVQEQTLPADADLVALEEAESRGPELLPFDPTDDVTYVEILARDASYARAMADVDALFA